MVVHEKQLNEFRNLVILESGLGWIHSGCLNADGAENQVINTNATYLFATDRCNYENDVYKFWDFETLSR